MSKEHFIGENQGFGRTHTRTDGLDPIKALTADKLTAQPPYKNIDNMLYALAHPGETGFRHGALIAIKDNDRNRPQSEQHTDAELRRIDESLRLECIGDLLDLTNNTIFPAANVVGSVLYGNPLAIPLLEASYRFPTYLAAFFQGLIATSDPVNFSNVHFGPKAKPIQPVSNNINSK